MAIVYWSKCSIFWLNVDLLRHKCTFIYSLKILTFHVHQPNTKLNTSRMVAYYSPTVIASHKIKRCLVTKHNFTQIYHRNYNIMWQNIVLLLHRLTLKWLNVLKDAAYLICWYCRVLDAVLHKVLCLKKVSFHLSFKKNFITKLKILFILSFNLRFSTRKQNTCIKTVKIKCLQNIKFCLVNTIFLTSKIFK